jgi:hypothetical protein
VITAPGIHDIPEDIYFADPVPGGSLSSSGARKLLPPSCPAIFRHEQDNPPPPKKVFDLGSAAHRLVLGSGPDLVLVDKPRWDDNDTKGKVAAIRDAGGIPLKRPEYNQVHAMAAAIRRHPVASALFDPDHGQPEQTLIWQDARTGVWCRARLDWLPNARPGRRLIVPDYKTCRSASPPAIAKAVYEHGYHQQTEWYVRGAQTLGLADEQAAFVFVCQEKEPPYLVTVVQLDEVALYVARERNRRAMETYAACVEADYWPGYPDDIHTISLPAWATREENL